MCPPGAAQSPADAFDVVSDGVDAQVEGVGDVAVTLASGDQFQYLEFAVRQVRVLGQPGGRLLGEECSVVVVLVQGALEGVG